MIEVANLTKRYGSHLAVDNISFTVKDGEILGFLGPNGAGKSTTMNMITGYLSATSGTISVAGYDILDNPDEAKRHIGYLPEHPPLYRDMTVREYLNFIYELKKTRLPREPHIDEICRLVKITDVAGRVIKHLSKGYQQRVGIAQALIGNPDVLILDEPTVGLDPVQIIEIRKLIGHLGKNHTVILSSHILSEIQAVCSRVIVINSGKIIADGAPDDLSRNLSEVNSVLVRVQGPENEVKKLLSTIAGVSKVTPMGRRERNAYEFAVEVAGKNDIRQEMFRRLSDRNWPILLMRPNELTLEEIFIRLVDGTIDASVLDTIKPMADDSDKAKALEAVNDAVGEIERPLGAPNEGEDK
ncbi:MAG: ATP-binding cassette domain-containing protein [Firmicutes bacterium]|nr:ATP-binding cassette domain-containing protein [Bacillota bacterium]